MAQIEGSNVMNALQFKVKLQSYTGVVPVKDFTEMTLLFATTNWGNTAAIAVLAVLPLVVAARAIIG
jgi:hypothetical protein